MFPAIITLTVLIFPLIKGTLGDPPNCSFKDDCVVANSIGVDYDSSIDSCVCDCKPGWKDYDCSKATDTYLRTVDFPKLGYSSEFAFNCRYAGTYKNATKRCQSFGDGWDIASVMSYNAWQIAWELAFFSQSNCWLGGNDVALPGTWVWQAGRYKGKAFFVNGTEVSGMFAVWSRIPPTDQQCNNHTKHWLAVDMWMKNYTDYYDECPDSACSVKNFPCPTCVVCERSPCVKKLDCVIANTKNVSGYYPCVCECYSGYSGNDCSINLVNSTTTLSTVPTMPSTTTLSPVPTTPTTTTLSPVPTMSSISTLSPVPTIPLLLVITLLLSYSHVLSRLL